MVTVDADEIDYVEAQKSDYDLLTVIMLGLGKADEAKGEPILRLSDVLLSAETSPEEKGYT